MILENLPGRHQIDDISLNGLSYHYIGNSYLPKSGTFALLILTKDKSLSLILNGRNISDNETGSMVSTNKMIRRRSIRFENVNKLQKKAIKRIIRKYSVR